MTQHLADNELQQFVNSKTNRPVEFSYEALPFEGRQLGIITIPLQERPVFLKQDFGKLKRGETYIRRGSATAIALPDEVARMGKAAAIDALQPVLQRISNQAQEEPAGPLTAETASKRVKLYLSNYDRYQIQLSEFVASVGSELAGKIAGPDFPTNTATPNKEMVRERIGQYEEISQVAVAIMATLCRWAKGEQVDYASDLLQLVANPLSSQKGGYKIFLDLRLYPALMLLHAGGIAAMAGKQYATLRVLLTEPKVYDFSGDSEPPLHGLTTYRLMNHEQAKQVLSSRTYTPMGDRLFDVLREPLRGHLPDDLRYRQCSDRFEYLKALLQADDSKSYCGIGCFGWRHFRPGESVIREVEQEVENMGRKWPPLLAGWFDGDPARYHAANQIVHKAVAELRWHF